MQNERRRKIGKAAIVSFLLLRRESLCLSFLLLFTTFRLVVDVFVLATSPEVELIIKSIEENLYNWLGDPITILFLVRWGPLPINNNCT